MTIVTLSEIKFILQTLDLSEEQRKLLLALTSKKQKAISVELADVLRELCTDRLDTHGFNHDYSPSNEGKKLEVLIDKFYVG